MIVQLPRGARLDAACLTGWTRPADTPVLSGAVVVSAAYRLVQHGAGPRVAVPDDAAVVFADAGTAISGGFDLLREADIALEKERTDIVVQGHIELPATTGGCVRVAGADWLVRRNMSGTAPDVARNLFGWIARTEAPRALADVPDIPELLPDVHLPGSYHPGFNNAYRRNLAGGPVETPGDRNRAPLPSGALVEIFQTPTGSDDAYSFRLPDLTLSARLRAYCGHGPDEAPAWRIVDTLPLTPDTLIVEPDQHRATVLWRVAWPYTSQPPDRWRLVQILSGGN